MAAGALPANRLVGELTPQLDQVSAAPVRNIPTDACEYVSRARGKTVPVLLDPLDFISRLCALIPPPRFHMLRYHGILAGHSRAAEVVPQESAKDESLEPSNDAQQLLFEPTPPLQPPPPSRHPWAWLLRRVFAVDIMTCPKCQGAMRVKSIATEASTIQPVLGMASRARPPPPALRQLKLDLAAA
ncbi:MAG: hypothetical protein ACI9KE_002284 [Polyangiales bacterium]|jgi:hypothetical protein